MAGLIGGLSVDQQTELLYVGYFNRAADGGGFIFWEQQNAAAQGAGQSAATALTNISNSFAPQAETLALYPILNTHLTVPVTDPVALGALSSLINSIYINLFGRASDAAGNAYWTHQLAT